jgi:CRISPR-associated protein Cas2
MESWLVCYDISDPKRLRRVATACEDYGVRKQYSVFLCRLSKAQFERLRARLYDLIHHGEDQVLFLPVCGKCVVKMESMGRPMEPVDARDVVVVV